MPDDQTSVIELAIEAAGAGRLSTQVLLWVLAATDLSVASAEEPTAGFESVRPLVVGHGDRQLLAVFTNPAMADTHREQSRYLVSVKGIDVLRRLPAGAGIVVNPGQSVGFELPLEGVEQIQGELGVRRSV